MTRDRLRVGVLVPELVAAGAERVVVDTVMELDHRRFDPTVITLVPGGPLEREISELSHVEVATLGFAGSTGSAVLKAGPEPIMRLHRILKQRRFDVLHSHLFPANLLALVFGRVPGTRLVVSEHSIISQETPARFAARSRILRQLYARADRVGFVCDAAARSYREFCGFPAANQVVVRNGAKLDRFLRATRSVSLRRALCPRPGATLFITVARWSHAKGLDLIPAVARQIIAAGEDAQFVIAGGPSVGEDIRLAEIIGAHGMEEHVSLLGGRSDIPEILAAADVFLLPSRYEGLPISVIEAMAAQLPVLSTAVGGLPEVVIHEQTGLLASGPNVDELAEHALALIRDPERARAMGGAGRLRATAEFTSRAMAARYESLYDELAGHAGRQLGSEA